MEYIDGEPLDKIMAELIRAGKRLPLIEQLDIIRQVCEGLDYAHQNDVFHRDIKPANVMRRRDGRVKIVDFGIARVQNSSTDTSLTQPMQVIGTVAYMAPERLKGGRGDGPADIFAVGVMLYYLLTGQEPFTGAEAMSVMHKVVNEPYAPLNTHLPEYPPAIDQILELALAKNPAARYSRAQEFAADLAAIINDINRGRIPGLLQDAERLVNEGRWDLASEKADEITRIDPQNAKARDISRKAGRGRREEADEERIRLKMREAQDFVAYGHYDQAIQVFEELVQRRPGNLEFQAQLEDAKKRRRDQNLKVSRRAEALSLFESGDLTGAIHRYEELLALNPTDEQLHEEYLRLKKEFEDQEQRSKTDRHIENARQAVGSQRYTDAIAIIEDIYKLKVDRPDVDRLYQEALKGRKDKDDERFRDQVLIQARKLRSVEQYAEALAELDQGLLRLPGDAVLLRLRSETDREAKNTKLRGWIAETIEKISVMALTAPDAALVELRQSMKELPGEERFELLEADLLKRIEKAEAVKKRAVCLRDGGEALYAGDPSRAKQIIQEYLRKYPSDEEIDRLLREVQNLESERELERRSSECEAQSRSLLDQGRFTEAISVIQPTLRETKNKRLARLLEEAERKKSEIDAITSRLGPQILNLRQAGKQEDAIALIESQDAAVLQNPVIQKILDELRKELNRNRALADAVSRSKRAVENGEWATAGEPFDDLQRVFGDFEALTSAISQFGLFRTQVADKIVGSANESAKASILARDEKSARKTLEAAAPAVQFASTEVTAEWRRLAQGRKIETPATGTTPTPQSKFPVWAAAVAVLVLLVGGVVLLRRQPPPLPTPTVAQIETSVRIKSVPGATVQIGSLPAIQTDDKGEAKIPVQPGANLSINVTKEGFTSYSESVDLEKGDKLLVPAPLTDKRTTGNLVVKGNVASFKVFVDGNLLGSKFTSGVPIPIAQGSHTIQYEADGFERSPAGAKVDIVKGSELKATFALLPKANSAAINDFSASSDTVGEDGGTVTLKWKTTNAKKILLDGDDVTDKTSKKVTVLADTSYTLTAVGDDGKSIKHYAEVHLSKPAPPSIISFTSTPTSVQAGERIHLTWQTSGANAVTINNGIGTKAANDSADYTVRNDASGTMTFELTAKGKGGEATKPISIAIAAAPKPLVVAAPAVSAPAANARPIVATAVSSPAIIETAGLKHAFDDFHDVFNRAYRGKDKECKSALSKLSSTISPNILDGFQSYCGDASSFSGNYQCNGEPVGNDKATRATWLCGETIVLKMKEGSPTRTPYPPANFIFERSGLDAPWKLVKWDVH
jgi:serine/threonine-protein kinase